MKSKKRKGISKITKSARRHDFCPSRCFCIQSSRMRSKRKPKKKSLKKKLRKSFKTENSQIQTIIQKPLDMDTKVKNENKRRGARMKAEEKTLAENKTERSVL